MYFENGRKAKTKKMKIRKSLKKNPFFDLLSWGANFHENY